MITITITITDKDGIVELRSKGGGDNPTPHEETVASIIAGAIKATGSSMSGASGCGECDSCKAASAKEGQDAIPFAMPVTMKDKIPTV